MDRRAIEDLFRPFGPVTIKRMFGGRGIYAGEMMFALEAYGEIYLKSDAQSAVRFDAEGLRPFAFDSKRGRMVTSYRLLPEAAHEDERVLKEWSAVGMEAARSCCKEACFQAGGFCQDGCEKPGKDSGEKAPPVEPPLAALALRASTRDAGAKRWRKS